MQLTLHVTHRTPRGASRLVHALSARSVKNRRAPSRHCRDARIYGHTTTAMHDMSNPPPLRARLSHLSSYRSSARINFSVQMPSTGKRSSRTFKYRGWFTPIHQAESTASTSRLTTIRTVGRRSEMKACQGSGLP